MTNADCCPLCDYRNRDGELLASHLLTQHGFADKVAAIGELGVVTNGSLHLWSEGACTCWCGATIEILYAPSLWRAYAEHLERHGGATAHYLETKLFGKKQWTAAWDESQSSPLIDFKAMRDRLLEQPLILPTSSHIIIKVDNDV